MKYLLIVFFILLTAFHPLETKVFICGSKGAKKYHYNENCRGLSACKHELVKTTLSEAQGFGLTLCGWED